MALTKPVPQNQQQPASPIPPVKPVGTFEAMGETTATAVPANDAAAAPAPAPAPTPAQAPAPAPVPVVQSAPSAVTVSKRAEASAFAKEVEDMKGAADFTYGNYRVFKGNNGAIVETGDGGGNLGRWVKVSMIAWDDHWEVSPGSKSEKSKDAVGYSSDGQTVRSIIGSGYSAWVGKDINDYVEYLKTDGNYPEAKKGRFIDIACVVHEADGEEAFNGEIIQVTLSSSSIPSFSAYQESLTMKAKAAARGIPGIKIPSDPFTFYFLRELASGNGNNWTKLKVLTSLPAKI